MLNDTPLRYKVPQFILGLGQAAPGEKSEINQKCIKIASSVLKPQGKQGFSKYVLYFGLIRFLKQRPCCFWGTNEVPGRDKWAAELGSRDSSQSHPWSGVLGHSSSRTPIVLQGTGASGCRSRALQHICPGSSAQRGGEQETFP